MIRSYVDFFAINQCLKSPTANMTARYSFFNETSFFQILSVTLSNKRLAGLLASEKHQYQIGMHYVGLQSATYHITIYSLLKTAHFSLWQKHASIQMVHLSCFKRSLIEHVILDTLIMIETCNWALPNSFWISFLQDGLGISKIAFTFSQLDLTPSLLTVFLIYFKSVFLKLYFSTFNFLFFPQLSASQNLTSFSASVSSSEARIRLSAMTCKS